MRTETFDGRSRLREWRAKLDALTADPPAALLYVGDKLDPATLVCPVIVIEVKFIDWSGAGRVRHPSYLGQREDKAAREVIRDVANPDAPRVVFKPCAIAAASSGGGKRWHGAIPPKRP